MHIHILAEVRAGSGGTIDAFSHEGKALDVVWQEVQVRHSSSRSSCRAQRCISADCVLPFRNAEIAAEALLRSTQERPWRSTACAKPLKARAPPRASLKGCSLTSQQTGQEPTELQWGPVRA